MNAANPRSTTAAGSLSLARRHQQQQQQKQEEEQQQQQQEPALFGGNASPARGRRRCHSHLTSALLAVQKRELMELEQQARDLVGLGNAPSPPQLQPPSPGAFAGEAGHIRLSPWKRVMASTDDAADTDKASSASSRSRNVGPSLPLPLPAPACRVASSSSSCSLPAGPAHGYSSNDVTRVCLNCHSAFYRLAHLPPAAHIARFCGKDCYTSYMCFHSRSAVRDAPAYSEVYAAVCSAVAVAGDADADSSRGAPRCRGSKAADADAAQHPLLLLSPGCSGAGAGGGGGGGGRGRVRTEPVLGWTSTRLPRDPADADAAGGAGDFSWVPAGSSSMSECGGDGDGDGGRGQSGDR